MYEVIEKNEYGVLVENNQKMKKHKDQPLWRDHYELIRDTKSIRNKLKFNFWVIDHFVYKKTN